MPGEKTPCEKAERRHTKRRQNESFNGVFLHGGLFCCLFSSFRAKISPFSVAGLIFLSLRMVFFRTCVFSHDVFSFRIASFRREKTKWHKPANMKPSITR